MEISSSLHHSKIVLNYSRQLKSFIHKRTNLSPFTKDFRV
jgi:hypothetical protein